MKTDKNSMPPSDLDEISFLDGFLIIVRQKRLVFTITGIVFLLGFTYALFAPSKYQAAAIVVREGQIDEVGSLRGLSALTGLRLNLGSVSGGLNVEAYPEILRSREVLQAVIREPFRLSGQSDSLDFIKYVSSTSSSAILYTLRKYTIGLPRLLKNSLTKSETQFDTATIEEELALVELASIISIQMSRESGTMTISITTRDRYLSVSLVMSLIKQLTIRVRRIYSVKQRDNLDFVAERFIEVQNELQIAELQLAHFIDSNQNPSTAELGMELERLRRQVTFKTQLYSELQSQLAQTRLELQKNTPIITILESPHLPYKPSGPKRKIIVILSLLLGIILGIGIAVIRHMYASQILNEDVRLKFEEIKSSLRLKK